MPSRIPFELFSPFLMFSDMPSSSTLPEDLEVAVSTATQLISKYAQLDSKHRSRESIVKWLLRVCTVTPFRVLIRPSFVRIILRLRTRAHFRLARASILSLRCSTTRKCLLLPCDLCLLHRFEISH